MYFDTFIENLRILDEREEDCGLLKISRFSGRNPDCMYCFFYADAPKKPNSPYALVTVTQTPAARRENYVSLRLVLPYGQDCYLHVAEFDLTGWSAQAY